ncbi:unnamed protein product [Parascedosporium putredinis]|uniref:AAA+ ATPase domain-containing protein n=1 Tax=Parascedosporium putredinis TaxID=1442378 RepID=A0A9P1H1D5_9PEZI|nr:unnamed protein product [Parascedosporium putredinis]CAI7992631.1 unnamed protein product [Parascedosporium putredinis]
MIIDCPACNKPPTLLLLLTKRRECLPKRQRQRPAQRGPAFPPSGSQQKRPAAAAAFFQTPAAKRTATSSSTTTSAREPGAAGGPEAHTQSRVGNLALSPTAHQHTPTAAKKSKTHRSAPLAERMRPDTLDDVFGQDLTDQLPSMILWGASGTGKTTIARCIARMVGSRFVETNATSTGVAEVKKMFQDAQNEAALTGRKTIIFCDEIHRFTKAQQDVFLKPVEAGTVTLIGATTENPSFRVQAALLSRCRTFTLEKLTVAHVHAILKRALAAEAEHDARPPVSALLDDEMLNYLAAFSDGDARTALNLLEMALSLARQPGGGGGGGVTKESIKASLTKTLVYDRAGDQHYDTISAFHKSIRGNDPDAALYYLARMLQSGEDPLRRPPPRRRRLRGRRPRRQRHALPRDRHLHRHPADWHARGPYPLAHCTVALCLAPKSTRAYRGFNNALSALREPGVAALPVPLHLRNAPTRLMQDLGYGGEYKDGKVSQQYLPNDLVGRRFLEDRDLGTAIDPDLPMDETWETKKEGSV